MKSAGMQMTESGDWTNKTTKSVVNQGRAMGYASRGAVPKFEAQFLSLMFLGQGLSKTFGGMIQKTLQMTGIFDAFAGVLASVLLPVLMPLIAKYLPKLIDWLDKGNNKKFAATLIIFAAVLGTVISQLSQLQLLFGAMKIGFWAGLGATLIIIAGTLVVIYGIMEAMEAWTQGDMARFLKGVAIVLAGIAMIIAGIALAVGSVGIAIGAAVVAIMAAITATASWISKFAAGKMVVLSMLMPLIAVAELVAKIGQTIGAWFDGKSGSSVWKDWNWTKSAAVDVMANRGEVLSGGMGAKSVSIPKLATGGIVTSPTTALIGEAGPEAVIPLSKMGESGIGNTINYNPTINVEMSGSNFSGEDLAAKINEALHDNLRSGF